MTCPSPSRETRLVEADHPALADVAHAMFMRNVGGDADPLFAQVAWIDPEIQRFWIEQVLSVRADLEHLARAGRLPG